MIDVVIDPKTVNPKYLALLQDTFHNPSSLKRYELLYGGAGSGKSYFIAQRKVLQQLSFRNRKTLIVRKVLRTHKHSTFALTLAVIASTPALTKFFLPKRTDYEILCPYTNSSMIFMGMDDPEKIKSVQDVTDIWIEEATEIDRESFLQLDLRLRGENKGKLPYQITMSFNPISVAHWLNKTFFAKETPDALLMHTTHEDNMFLDDRYKQVLEGLKEMDEDHYRVYALGEWGSFGNRVYTNYTIKDFDEDDERGDVCYGLDFGFNNPTTLIKVRCYDDCFYVTELLYASGLTNSDLIEILETKRREIRSFPIYADCAEPARIEEISRAGFNVLKSSKEIKKGIDYVKSQRVFIHPSAVSLIKEIESYSWRQDRDGNNLDDPVKYADHAMDAMRYAIYSHSRANVTSAMVDIF